MRDFNIFNFFKNSNVDLPFKKGQLINISHASSNEPIMSVIKEIKNTILTVYNNGAISKNVIRAGDTVTCKILANGLEYVISGMVESIDKHLKIQIVTYQKYKNNRKAKRYNVNYKSSIITTLTFSKFDACVKNISASGVYIVVHNNSIPIGNEGIITIVINVQNEDVLYFKVKIIRIAHQDEFDSYYTKIIEIDDYNKKILSELINTLKKEEKALISSIVNQD